MDRNRDYYRNIDRALEEMNRERKKEEETKRDRDKNYFRQLYPMETKQYLRAVRNGVDRIEGRNSFIYDEYPDQIQLERLLEDVLRTIPYQNRIPRESQRQILRILMYDEIYERRNLTV